MNINLTNDPFWSEGEFYSARPTIEQSVAQRASEIVNTFEQTRPEREPDQTPGNPDQTFVTATCEECGESSQFIGAMLGSVQECPHCGKFMDVSAGGDDLDL